MKIALVLDDSIDRPDGVQQYVLALGKRLRELGHEVHYLCSDSERTDLTVHALAKNVPVKFNGNGLRIPLPTSRKALREFLSGERYDVLHVQMPHSPFFAARVVAAARAVQGEQVRIVGTFHILPHSEFAARATGVLGRILRKNLSLFDAFCAVSPAAAEFAQERFAIDCRVIPNGIDIDRFSQAQGAAPHQGIVFLGRLVERKGAGELIEAFALLPQELRASTPVRIGGKGPLLEGLRQRVTALGLQEQISFDGFVSEEDKAAYLQQAAVAVFPATGGESFGIVLVEAMASGAQVVLGGDNPGYRSVMGDGPYSVVDPHNTRVFAEVLETLLTDADLRKQIHGEQQERMRQFDVKRVAEQVLELYGSSL